MASNKASDTHYGLSIYEDDADGTRWAVGTENQANRAAERSIEDRLWAVSPEFLVAFFQRHNPYLRDMTDSASDELERWLTRIRATHADNAVPLFRALIGSHLPTLCQELIRFSGRGKFLALYDHVERDSTAIEGLPPRRLAYRLE